MLLEGLKSRWFLVLWEGPVAGPSIRTEGAAGLCNTLPPPRTLLETPLASVVLTVGAHAPHGAADLLRRKPFACARPRAQQSDMARPSGGRGH